MQTLCGHLSQTYHDFSTLTNTENHLIKVEESVLNHFTKHEINTFTLHLQLSNVNVKIQMLCSALCIGNSNTTQNISLEENYVTQDMEGKCGNGAP